MHDGADEAVDYVKVGDTLDVWFDSGTTHFSVLQRDPRTHFPADMYLEGSDQHRGWFHSSLLASCAMHGCAPYKQVLTHGFTVDAASLPGGVIETHVSLFDGSNEGLRVDGRPVFSVQYHPEASPGPHDSHYLFEEFVSMMRAHRNA